MSMNGRPTVLFLCPDNGGPSLLAEALAFEGHPDLRAFSAAALAPGAVDPALLACLGGAGLRTDGLSPKPAQLFALSGAPRLDAVVALGEDARRALRRLAFIGPVRSETWQIPEVPRTAPPAQRRAAYDQLLTDLGAALASLERRIAFRLSGVAA